MDLGDRGRSLLAQALAAVGRAHDAVPSAIRPKGRATVEMRPSRQPLRRASSQTALGMTKTAIMTATAMMTTKGKKKPKQRTPVASHALISNGTLGGSKEHAGLVLCL